MQGSLIFPAISELARDDVEGVVSVEVLEVEELGVAVLDGLFEFPVESEDFGLGDYYVDSFGIADEILEFERYTLVKISTSTRTAMILAKSNSCEDEYCCCDEGWSFSNSIFRMY